MIYLEVACNDPDNGLFAGRVSMMEIGDAEFEANNLNGYAFAELPDAIRIAGKTWRIANSKEWFGNWCWNRYELYHPQKTTCWYFAEFVIWLRERRLFSCTAAPTAFFEWFNWNEDVPPKEVHRMVCDLKPVDIYRDRHRRTVEREA